LNEKFLLLVGLILAAALRALTCVLLVLCGSGKVGAGVNMVTVGSVSSEALRTQDGVVWEK